MLTALLPILFVAAVVIAFVGYVSTYHLQECGIPFSVPVCRLDGQLPPGVMVVASDLERFGCVADSLGTGEYRIRPLNRYEQREKRGSSADPHDMSSSARLVVVDGVWRLEVRKAPGAGLVMSVIALWWLAESSASALSVGWGVFVAASVWYEWRSVRRIYERLGGQLGRLGV